MAIAFLGCPEPIERAFWELKEVVAYVLDSDKLDVALVGGSFSITRKAHLQNKIGSQLRKKVGLSYKDFMQQHSLINFLSGNIDRTARRSLFDADEASSVQGTSNNEADDRWSYHQAKKKERKSRCATRLCLGKDYSSKRLNGEPWFEWRMASK